MDYEECAEYFLGNHCIRETNTAKELVCLESNQWLPLTSCSEIIAKDFQSKGQTESNKNIMLSVFKKCN